jgi:hypothetical protein
MASITYLSSGHLWSGNMPNHPNFLPDTRSITTPFSARGYFNLHSFPPPTATEQIPLPTITPTQTTLPTETPTETPTSTPEPTETPTPEPTDTPIPAAIPKPKLAPIPPPKTQNFIEPATFQGCLLTNNVAEGKATYYSHAGCLGCSPGQIMANGQPFRENDITLAYFGAPMNSLVKITNLNNGSSIIARVTDLGGFRQYGILADLSKGAMKAIAGDQMTPVRITQLKCP